MEINNIRKLGSCLSSPSINHPFKTNSVTLSDDIHVIVKDSKLLGHFESTFSAPRQIICQQSPIFVSALSQNFNLGQTPRVVLRDTTIETFSRFLEWIGDQDMSRYTAIEDLRDLWLLGKRLLIPKLQNAVTDELCNRAGNEVDEMGLVSLAQEAATRGWNELRQVAIFKMTQVSRKEVAIGVEIFGDEAMVAAFRLEQAFQVTYPARMLHGKSTHAQRFHIQQHRR